MADSKTFPSDKEDEQEQRLILDLRHMYHTEVEIAQALSRVRSHLEASHTGRSDIRPGKQQRDGLLSTQQAGTVQADGHGTSTRFPRRKAWQQRTGSIAAAVFVITTVWVDHQTIRTSSGQYRPSTCSMLRQDGP